MPPRHSASTPTTPALANRLKHGQSATPMAFVRAMAAALTKANIPLGEWLEKAQITPHELQRPNATITAAQMEVASEWAMQALDDEALGWFERALPWGSYGMLARASMGSPNLGVAMRRWCRHHGLLTHTVTLELALAEHDADAVEGAVTAPGLTEVRLLDHGVPNALQEFCHVTVMRNLLGFASWAVDSRLSLHSVACACKRPQHAQAYEVLFPCEVTFEAEYTCMRLASDYLQLPLRRDETAINTMLQRALPLTVRHYRRDRLLVQQVRQLLQSHSQAITALEAAAQLHLSTRSLFRQLRDEGATWQQLKTQHAMTLAQQCLLNHPDWPIKLVASHSGFANEKSFTRAFKTFTGQAPNAFRQQLTR